MVLLDKCNLNIKHSIQYTTCLLDDKCPIMTPASMAQTFVEYHINVMKIDTHTVNKKFGVKLFLTTVLPLINSGYVVCMWA